jgi:hypothetical protein
MRLILSSYSIFCLPVHPSRLRDIDIERVADEQAATYEVLYVREERPVLLPEYLKELRGLLYYFGGTVKEAVDHG